MSSSVLLPCPEAIEQKRGLEDKKLRAQAIDRKEWRPSVRGGQSSQKDSTSLSTECTDT